ncbi:hypothetical protein [Parapedobacter sp. 10938]|uniref:hypothetical protein n=1 Tax=Parapedobacter flavus TaxID=3110225 RepID=UPI002DB9C0FC|nr:hypothetical protein [Parapedobacter sp. 10938]MEC3882079.1 hypothetical protein [Parapedobacter sp. 10938]
MKNQPDILKLSDELETIIGDERYALKGGFNGGYSDGSMSGTGMITYYDDYGYSLVLESYTISGSSVLAYKAVGTHDQFGQIIRDPITQQMIPPSDMNALSNCFGYALGGGDYYFLDPITKDPFESQFGYVACSKSEAASVLIYDGSAAVHAGKYNPETDTYDAKGGGSMFYTRTGMTEEEFYRPYDDDPNNPNPDYETSDVVYYKKMYY